MKKLLVALALLVASLLIPLKEASALNSPYQGVYTWLPSAARTTAQTLTDQSNLYVTGIEAVCNVTSASGTGGLQLQIQGKDLVSGSYYTISTTTANTTTGVIRNIVGANVFNVAATGNNVNVNTYVPYTWRIVVAVGDASSYTYSCGYTLYSSS